MLNSRQRLSWHCWIVPRSQHTAMWRREQSGKCSQMMSSKVGIPGLELSKSSALLCFCKQKFCFWVLSGRFIKLISVPYSVKGHGECCKAQCNAKCLPVKKVCNFWSPRDICMMLGQRKTVWEKNWKEDSTEDSMIRERLTTWSWEDMLSRIVFFSLSYLTSDSLSLFLSCHARTSKSFLSQIKLYIFVRNGIGNMKI